MTETVYLTKPLIDKNDPRLLEATKPFDFSNPPDDPVAVAHCLAQTMLANNGLGLAAPQIGMMHRAFAITGNPILVCFNPRIVDKSTEELYLEEGCLTFPGLIMKVKRPKTIKVRYTMANGETVTEKMTGMTARCFQHELDHLDGILFMKRATLFHKEQAYRKMKNR